MLKSLLRLSHLLIVLCLLLISLPAFSQNKFNGGFEKTSAPGRPVGWIFGFSPDHQKAYKVTLDSIVKLNGKYSLSIEKTAAGSDFGVVDYAIPYAYRGKMIKLKGVIKTENVEGGYAGLWLRIDGTSAFSNMSDQPVKGTTPWTEYNINLPYDMDNATVIHAGGLLVGSGKMWIDSLRLYIDNKPIDQAVVKPIVLAKADTSYIPGSKVDTILLNKQQITNLSVLGQVWGFLKYHHPAIAKGDINFDAELFRILPSVLKAGNNTDLSMAIENWIDKLGMPPLCKNCSKKTGPDISVQPDYGDMFNGSVLSESVTNKLKYILDNRNISKHYYVSMDPNIGNPIFTNEAAYGNLVYPDAGYRLLSLYRYWNMIQYFFPYKKLIGQDWNAVLPAYIPKYVNAASQTDYLLTCLQLIADVHDTHANIWSAHPALEAYKGKFTLPFQAKFIEDKLVVTGYYSDTLNVKEKLKLGAVITAINGVKIDELIKKYLPLTAASNYPTQLRDLPRTYLLRNSKEDFTLEVANGTSSETVLMKGLERKKLNFMIDYYPDPKVTGYRLLEDQIGYVFPGRYKNKDLPEIEKLFAGTKGIIVDMRCYPSEFMPFTFVPYIKAGNNDFVKFTSGSVNTPGLFSVAKPIGSKGLNTYKGKVVVIVNEQSQSQAEYTTMAFQASPNVTVIGSTTAGADGNVSSISLPGGISTMISGLGVLYPDGTETQRKGVKIDYMIKPTIEGVRTGRDELLLKAREIILNGKP